MAITAADIKWYYSGSGNGNSNSDPNASIGGYISSVELTNDALENIFDNVSGDESSAGDTEYRAFFVKNTHATLTWQNVKAWMLSNTTSNDDTVNIGIEDSKGDNKQRVADESTAPTISSGFVTAVNKANGLSLGNLAPGDVYMVWLKRIVNASAAAVNDNAFEVKIEGDTAAS